MIYHASYWLYYLIQTNGQKLNWQVQSFSRLGRFFDDMKPTVLGSAWIFNFSNFKSILMLLLGNSPDVLLFICKFPICTKFSEWWRSCRWHLPVFVIKWLSSYQMNILLWKTCSLSEHTSVQCFKWLVPIWNTTRLEKGVKFQISHVRSFILGIT